MDRVNVVRLGGKPAVMTILVSALSGLVYGGWGAVPVKAATPDPSVRALQRQLEQHERQLEERDAVIEDLQRRVQELERRSGGSVKPATPKAEATPGATAAAPGEAAQEPTAPTEGRVPGEEQKTAETPPPPEASAPAPGQVTVTEEEAERALERTLVAVGVLLLPFGQIEVEPAFSYIRRESDSSLPGPVPKLGRNEFQPSISARAGLPFDSQLEFDLPYNVVQQDQHVDPSTGQQESRTETGHSVGDLSVGIAKTVFQERGWRPDLIARFTWDMPTGDTQDNGVLLDGGFNAITGQLTALKRQDPLAFFASTFYQKTFERNDFEPGDEFGFSLGAFLATSPETSLGISLDQTFSDDTRFNGSVINDSDQVAAVFNVGVSSILAPGVLLLLNAGIGLTDESPDYAVTISLPIRFNLPGL
jgi:Putative MetA-pathway of phenol degradation